MCLVDQVMRETVNTACRIVYKATHDIIADLVTVSDILCECTNQSLDWCVKGTGGSGAPDLAPGARCSQLNVAVTKMELFTKY